MSVDYLDGLDGRFPSGNLVVISSGSNVGKATYDPKEVIRKNLRWMIKNHGPLPWDQFQRMASAAYGTGAVGSMQDFYAATV